MPRAFVEEVGQLALLAWSSATWSLRPPYRIALFVEAMEFIGFQSVFIISLTGWFSGGVLALQTVYGFRQFGAEGMVGGVVALSLTRELSPVFASLMLTSRAGSAIATELGTMRVTDQIDALATMAVNPVQYLVVPRVLAGVVMMPALCMLFTVTGMVGAYMVGVGSLGIDPGVFMDRVRWYVDADDLFGGLLKAAIFGYVVTLIACRQGFWAKGGAAGVGVAVTKAVVFGSVSVLVLDYLLTALITPV
ncbi:MAG: ABC transporter permease [Deltaproteobacteria bacterium]|nr:ABC transporter permease [Deltaproteobacteria bacterium]